MSDKQLINQEIERIIEEETPISKGSDYYHGVKESMGKLLKFINSLPEEPASEDLENEIERFLDEDEGIPSYSKTARHFAEWGRNHFEDKSEMVNEDLEEAAYKYCEKVNHHQTDIITDSFKAGAEWQKQQMKDALQTEYEKGRFDMREEMMKDAVHAWVNTYESVTNPYDNRVAFITNLSLSKFRNNGTAQIIIVKED